MAESIIITDGLCFGVKFYRCYRPCYRMDIDPAVSADWMYKPVIQTSQVGYHPNQSKTAIIELDKGTWSRPGLSFTVLIKTGGTTVRHDRKGGDISATITCRIFLKSMRSLYQIEYGRSQSSTFRIASDKRPWRMANQFRIFPAGQMPYLGQREISYGMTTVMVTMRRWRNRRPFRRVCPGRQDDNPVSVGHPCRASM